MHCGILIIFLISIMKMHSAFCYFCKLPAIRSKVLAVYPLYARYTNSQILMRKGDNKGTDKYTKSNLPSKECEACGRPFTWRKKWEKVWEEVKYCSDKCRMHRNKSSSSTKQQLSMIKFDAKPFNWRKFSTLSVIPFLFGGIDVAKGAIPYKTTREEIRQLSSVIDWKYVTKETFSGRDFRRLDESDDATFYDHPRFVEHIDNNAVSKLTTFHENLIVEYLKETKKSAVDVVDLCSSWVSHIPTKAALNSLVVVGMNKEELQANNMQTTILIQDLNKSPTISSLNSESADIVLLQLSIDYLTHPVDVLKEAYRVLRPGGKIVISNRLFFDKAVAVWTGKGDLEHVEIVEEYLYLAGFPASTISADSLVDNRDKDPLYVVLASK